MNSYHANRYPTFVLKEKKAQEFLSKILENKI